eukprot:scpid95396/ scgid28696/ 
MSRPNAVSIVLITAILLVALISSTIANQPASYTGASLTGYKYCASRSTILKRTLTGEKFTFQGAKQLCQTKGGHLVSVHAISIGCVSDLIPLGLTVWIDDLLPGSGGKIAYVTAPIGILISSTRNRQHVVCEIPCHRSAGDRIASISKTGSVTCIPGDTFGGLQPVCSGGTQVGKCAPAQLPGSQNPFCEEALRHVELYCKDDTTKTWRVGDRCFLARKERRLYCT